MDSTDKEQTEQKWKATGSGDKQSHEIVCCRRILAVRHRLSVIFWERFFYIFIEFIVIEYVYARGMQKSLQKQTSIFFFPLWSLSL